MKKKKRPATGDGGPVVKGKKQRTLHNEITEADQAVKWTNTFAAIGVTDNDDDPKRARRRAIYQAVCQAQKTASICAKCRKPIAAGEPVWRIRIDLGRSMFGGRHHRVVPVCAACKPRYHGFTEPEPCEGCGRDVHQGSFRERGHTFCCEQCQQQTRIIQARHQRAEARGLTRVCLECGETFKPKRADSKFCGVACKQKAYRHRVSRYGCGQETPAIVGSRNALRIAKRTRGVRSESRNGAAS